ncbi:hypothetical protein Tco_1226388 [Tanacetum coccineum]
MPRISIITINDQKWKEERLKARRFSFLILVHIGYGDFDSYSQKTDDLFIFACGDVESSRVIMDSIEEFKLTSGLVPSIPKRELSVKYLGVPLISLGLLNRDFKILVEKVKNRIKDWKNKSLSFAGRLQLYSHGHLFFECPFSLKVWSYVRDLAGMDLVSLVLHDIIVYLQPIGNKRTAKSVFGKLILAASACSYSRAYDHYTRWESALDVVEHRLSLVACWPYRDDPTQAILDVTAEGIFLYKSPNQAFQFLEDKVLFEHDWPINSKAEHHQKSVSLADGSDSNTNDSRLLEKLEALTIKMDSQIIRLNEELQDIRNKYNELKEGNASKNRMKDDTSMCERHEVNSIQSEDYQNQDSNDSYFRQSYHDRNDSEKSLTELNNDMRNDLEDFKRRIRSMRTVHDKLFDRDDQYKIYLEKSITKFLEGQRVTNMFFKNNVNDMILKMKQNKKNFQTKIKNMERKINEWSKSQNVSSEQAN